MQGARLGHAETASKEAGASAIPGTPYSTDEGQAPILHPAIFANSSSTSKPLTAGHVQDGLDSDQEPRQPGVLWAGGATPRPI